MRVSVLSLFTRKEGKITSESGLHQTGSKIRSIRDQIFANSGLCFITVRNYSDSLKESKMIKPFNPAYHRPQNGYGYWKALLIETLALMQLSLYSTQSKPPFKNFWAIKIT